MHLLQAINSDLSVLIVCNKTGGTIKGDKKKAKKKNLYPSIRVTNQISHPKETGGKIQFCRDLIMILEQQTVR